jgi:hypothetical protein
VTSKRIAKIASRLGRKSKSAAVREVAMSDLAQRKPKRRVKRTAKRSRKRC